MSASAMSMDKIVSERALTKLERTGAHSHIRGLGLDQNLAPKEVSEGMVGQLKARKAAGILVDMIKNGKLAGRAILLSGEPGSGKTAIAIGIAKTLSPKTPFISTTAAEFFSLDMSKTEALMQAFRKAMCVEMMEEQEILEGEVVELIIERPADGVTNTRMGRVMLKTTAMETQFDMGQKMIDEMMRKKVSAGDIIVINKATGEITKLGRNFNRAQDYDAMGPSLKFVQTPDGEIQKRTTTVHMVSLHEMDVVNSRQDGFMALFTGDTGEIKAEIREKVNARVSEWRQEGKVVIRSGVLFIDEVHMLDAECFSFLNGILETEFAPILILATNRGFTKIRGTDYISPYGLPTDFLDRVTIINTMPYSREEMISILTHRAEEEEVNIEKDAILCLTHIAEKTSLRYASQLIMLSHILCKQRKATTVTREDCGKAYHLFYDSERSKKYLEDNENAFLYSVPGTKEGVSRAGDCMDLS